MKSTITLILFLIFPVLCFSNEIDKLKNDEDVNTFLQKINPKYKLTEHGELSWDTACSKTVDSLGFTRWKKADLDNDGTTDLLVYIRYDYSENYLIAILDNNKDYSTYFISAGPFPTVYFPLIKTLNKSTIILLYKETGNDTASWSNGPLVKWDKTRKVMLTDTLIYKFNGFINYYAPHIPSKIKHITFSTTECFGRCPIFTLDIDANRNVVYKADKYNVRVNDPKDKKSNTTDTGEYAATIDTLRFNKLMDVLNYIDFSRVRNEYAVGWTDDAGCYLTITYENGLVKKIYDYGKMGTFSLREVYHKLYDIRKAERWVRKK